MSTSAWTMKVPLDRDGNFLEFQLKEPTIDVFMAVQTLIEKKKWEAAVEMFVTELRIDGDEVTKMRGNFIAFNSALKMVTEILEPVPGVIKKN